MSAVTSSESTFSNGSEEGSSQITALAEISACQKMLSAVSGSLLTSILVTPLDVVRVRQQSQPRPKHWNPSSSIPSFAKLPPNLGVTACCREVFWINNASTYCIATGAPASAPSQILSSAGAMDVGVTSPSMIESKNCAASQTRQTTFTSTLDGLRKIARNEGITSLWRGLSPTLVMAVPANLIYFTGYDSLRHDIHSPIREYVPDAYAPLLAGSMARMAAAATISPIEMFRTRMQAATTTNSGAVFAQTLQGLKRMARTEGYSSLWRGLTLTMWRDVPFSGIYWWGYEALRDLLTWSRGLPLTSAHCDNPYKGRDHAQASTFVDSFIAGALSGAVASIITTPFDVGKTRRQVLEHTPKINANASATKGRSGATWSLRPEERSMPKFLYSIWRDEGIGGLFKGWAARTLKVAPACAIMISSYEIGKKMARSMNQKKRGHEVG